MVSCGVGQGQGGEAAVDGGTGAEWGRKAVQGRKKVVQGQMKDREGGCVGGVARASARRGKREWPGCWGRRAARGGLVRAEWGEVKAESEVGWGR
jgi:hypothetical protein